MKIEVHIGRLLLEGVSFAREDQARLREALQRRLEDRLALDADGGDWRESDRAAIAGGAPVQIAGQATAAQWGSGIADSVHEALCADRSAERAGGDTPPTGDGAPR